MIAGHEPVAGGSSPRGDLILPDACLGPTRRTPRPGAPRGWWCRERDSNLRTLLPVLDFESSASANSAIPAATAPAARVARPLPRTPKVYVKSGSRPGRAGNGALLPSRPVRVSDFDYDLPQELIAQFPTPRRRDSRLLVVDPGSGGVAHRTFPDICESLVPGDLVVANDTRVIRGRLFATKPTGGRVEILIERVLAPDRVLAWAALGQDAEARRAAVRRPRARLRGAVPARGSCSSWRSPASTTSRGSSSATARCRFRPTSAARRSRRTPSAIRPCTRAVRVRWRRRPPACTSTRRSSPRWTGAAWSAHT